MHKMQSTERKKMATDKFTLRTKTLKELTYKTTKKTFKSFKLHKRNADSIGATAVKPYLPICPVGLVWLARYCGKMYSRHLFFLPRNDGGVEVRSRKT